MGQRGRVLGSRDARFQQWRSLLTNRAKRHRAGMFLVHGVRPITLAVEHGWQVATWLVRDTPTLSAWARTLLADSAAERVVLADELLAELAEKNENLPELIALVTRRDHTLDDAGSARADDPPLVLAFDRPNSPGNLGTVIRSADAFGADAVVVTGHAADLTDPRTVRASTGSVFAVPVVTLADPAELRGWADTHRATVIGADEHADTDIDRADLTGPLVIAVGNETSGLSAAWRDACDTVVGIPIGGSASSLNAATAGGLLLYEAARQRGFPRRRQRAGGAH